MRAAIGLIFTVFALFQAIGLTSSRSRDAKPEDIMRWHLALGTLPGANLAILPVSWFSRDRLGFDFEDLGGGTLAVWFALVWLGFFAQKLVALLGRRARRA